MTRMSTDVLAMNDPDVSAALQFIRRNPNRLIQVDDVVEATNVSRRVLEKRFKAILRRSVHQEIRRVRVNNIVQLLIGTDMNVTEIALHAGFDGVEHIARYFRKETGMSLRNYRQAPRPTVEESKVRPARISGMIGERLYSIGSPVHRSNIPDSFASGGRVLGGSRCPRPFDMSSTSSGAGRSRGPRRCPGRQPVQGQGRARFVPLKARAFRPAGRAAAGRAVQARDGTGPAVPAVAGRGPAAAHLPRQRRPAVARPSRWAAGRSRSANCAATSSGHYLSACALMYASTGDERLKEKGDAVVAGLAECQAKIGSGYLSAYPEEFIDRVEASKPVWAPYYTLHKIYAGLLDMYVYCDNPQALEVCQEVRRLGHRPQRPGSRDEQMQKMLGNEHGGMNEALANLYAVTGDEKYLRSAQRFNHMAVLGPASQARGQAHRPARQHADPQVHRRRPAVRADRRRIGCKTASTFFWDTVVNERSYVIGGHSDGEHFSPKETLSQALGPNTTETCNTYNMLKLTRHLFCWDPQAEYADYYERALYNHILASQNPETGMMCYYVPLRSGLAQELQHARRTRSGAAPARASRTTPSTATASTSTTATRPCTSTCSSPRS